MYRIDYDSWKLSYSPEWDRKDPYETERRDLAGLQEQRAELERELEDYPTQEDATEDDAIAIARIEREIRTLDEQIRELRNEIGE